MKIPQKASGTASGFTLIELIMVIVILGILAATALPRFVNLGTEARVAAVNGFAGGLRSAATIIRSTHAARGGTGTTVTTQDGTVVAVDGTTGLPTSAAAGISSALDTTGFTAAYTAPTTTFTYEGTTGNCQAVYNATTGAVAVTTTGC